MISSVNVDVSPTNKVELKLKVDVASEKSVDLSVVKLVLLGVEFSFVTFVVVEAILSDAVSESSFDSVELSSILEAW